jgi:large subunit ribosomal protein L21
MYAVIKTGGKQYRVEPGDLLVVEKLEGEPGAQIAFKDVLMLGDGPEVSIGAPLIDGARVNATLVETRKGEKIKIFKKIRRQGYRRTGGHRQIETILRVTGIAGAGKESTWEGEIDLTPVATLRARARNLARGMETAESKAAARAARKASSKTAVVAEPVKAAPPAKATKAKAAAPKPAAKAKVAETSGDAAPAKAPAKPRARKTPVAE